MALAVNCEDPQDTWIGHCQAALVCGLRGFVSGARNDGKSPAGLLFGRVVPECSGEMLSASRYSCSQHLLTARYAAELSHVLRPVRGPQALLQQYITGFGMPTGGV